MLWIAWAASLALDIAFSLAAAYVFTDTDRGWAAVGIFAAIQIASILLALRGLVWNFIIYRYLTKKHLVSAYVDQLQASQLPQPRRAEESPMEYLARIVDDDDQGVSIRISAAMMFARLQYPGQTGHFGESLRCAAAFEDAMELHGRNGAAKHDR